MCLEQISTLALVLLAPIVVVVNKLFDIVCGCVVMRKAEDTHMHAFIPNPKIPHERRVRHYGMACELHYV